MLRARATMKDGRPLLILGLEQGNIDRLRAGAPILFDCAPLGIVGECLIFYGETCEAMVAKLEAQGFQITQGTA